MAIVAASAAIAACPAGSASQAPWELTDYAILGIRTVAAPIKPVVWIGSTKADLSGFPDEVRDAIGFALFVAQVGGGHASAKPLHGYGGAGVLEVIDNFDGNTYRAVYTVRLAGRVYALHAFQKKSRSGIATPKADIDLINARLAAAEAHHAAWLGRRGARSND